MLKCSGLNSWISSGSMHALWETASGVVCSHSGISQILHPHITCLSGHQWSLAEDWIVFLLPPLLFYRSAHISLRDAYKYKWAGGSYAHDIHWLLLSITQNKVCGTLTAHGGHRTGRISLQHPCPLLSTTRALFLLLQHQPTPAMAFEITLPATSRLFPLVSAQSHLHWGRQASPVHPAKRARYYYHSQSPLLFSFPS